MTKAHGAMVRSLWRHCSRHSRWADSPPHSSCATSVSTLPFCSTVYCDRIDRKPANGSLLPGFRRPALLSLPALRISGSLADGEAATRSDRLRRPSRSPGRASTCFTVRTPIQRHVQPRSRADLTTANAKPPRLQTGKERPSRLRSLRRCRASLSLLASFCERLQPGKASLQLQQAPLDPVATVQCSHAICYVRCRPAVYCVTMLTFSNCSGVKVFWSRRRGVSDFRSRGISLIRAGSVLA